MMSSPQQYTATSAASTVTSYNLPGLNLSFALPYFGILLLIELVVAIYRYRAQKHKLVNNNSNKAAHHHHQTQSKKKRDDKKGASGDTSQDDDGRSHTSNESELSKLSELGPSDLLELNNEHRLFRWNDSFSSLCCGVIQQMAKKVFTKYLELICYCSIYHYCRLWTITDPNQTSIRSVYWWLTLLITDHQYYWLHRFVHECNMGWATHAPHHSSEEYNLVTALRQGAFQNIFSMMFNLPMALLGIGPELYAIHSEISLLYQYWIHTRLIVRFPRWIEYVFNTPSHHRVHHGRNAEYIDKNYGGILIVFDRLFGTFEPERNPVAYGLVHPLQSFDPINSQMHHWVDMVKQARSLPTWKQRIQVFVRGPGFNPVDGSTYGIPDTPPNNRLRKYDPQIPASATVYAIVHFASLFLMALSFVEYSQETYLMTLGQFSVLLFGFYNVSLLFDGYFTRFCYSETIRLSVLSLLFGLNSMRALPSGTGLYLVHHLITRELLQSHQLSNILTTFHLLSVLYLVSRLFKLKDVPRPAIQNWEEEKEQLVNKQKHE